MALRHLQLLDEWRVLDHVTEMAEHLGSRLDGSIVGRPGVGDVRRRGLMVGVELAPPRERCDGVAGCARPPSFAASCCARWATWW